MRRFFRTLLLLLGSLFIASLFYAPHEAMARAGGGEGYHGGGGGGGGGRGGGHGGGGGGLIFDLIYLCFRYPALGVPVLIIVVLVIYYGRGQQSGIAYARNFERNTPSPDPDLMNRQLALLRSRDPQFDPNAFAQRVGQAFTKIQEAWCAQNLVGVRPFISDGVHERFLLQFDEQKAEGYRDQMQNIAIDSITLADVSSDEIYDQVAMRVAARASDVHISLADGRPIPGSGSPGTFVEIWTFLRRRGASTLTDKPGLIEGNCPNCGAAVEMNQSANCAHCGAALRSGEYDWVLTEITQEIEWEASGGAMPGGLAALRRADPNLNIASLEDRVSVVFWRKIAAARLGKIDPIRRVASPDYCEQTEKKWKAETDGRRFYGKVAVGAVQVVGLDEQGTQGNQRAVIEVRWSGQDYAAHTGAPPTVAGPASTQRTLLVLERAVGSTTDVAKGVSSAHCPNCGAPESGGTSGACEFCGTALNDGKHGWVLTQTAGRASDEGRTVLSSLRVDRSAAAVDNLPPGVPISGVAPSISPARTSPGSLGLIAWVIQTALADGNLDPREVDTIRKLAAARNVPDQRVQQLLQSIQNGSMQAPQPANIDEARDWLRAMAAAAAADGRIDKAEYAMLMNLAAQSGISESEVQSLFRRG